MTLLVVLQVAMLVASLFAAIPVAAADPTDDPGASAPPTTEPSDPPSPEPTAEPTAEPTPEPTPDVTPAPDPIPTEPAPAEPTPAPTGEPAPLAPPTITSDKDDYHPGELVTLTGSGWQPGETVQLWINDDWGSTWNRRADAIADTNGVIVDAFNLPDWFVAVYTVEATGALSGVVTMSFTDSNPRFLDRGGTNKQDGSAGINRSLWIDHGDSRR